MNIHYDHKDYMDFNDAEDQGSFDIIPDKTIAKVCLHITPGGYDYESLGWTGGFATRNPETDAVYLKCDFTVMEGPFAKQKVFSLIGLHSEKGVNWHNMGRAFIKGILNSARGINPEDKSPQAVEGRRLKNSFRDLEGIVFWGLIEVEEPNGENKKRRNVLQKAITPDHKDYPGVPAPSISVAPLVVSPAPTGAPPPSWMQGL